MASHRSTAAPPHTGTRIDRIGVVAPVNNEEHGLRQCLDALARACRRAEVTTARSVAHVIDSPLARKVSMRRTSVPAARTTPTLLNYRGAAWAISPHGGRLAGSNGINAERTQTA